VHNVVKNAIRTLEKETLIKEVAEETRNALNAGLNSENNTRRNAQSRGTTAKNASLNLVFDTPLTEIHAQRKIHALGAEFFFGLKD
jgi:hypothetical protein